MARKKERVLETRDPEAIKLLKDDPDAFFKKTRRLPFGFSAGGEAKKPKK